MTAVPVIQQMVIKNTFCAQGMKHDRTLSANKTDSQICPLFCGHLNAEFLFKKKKKNFNADF